MRLMSLLPLLIFFLALFIGNGAPSFSLHQTKEFPFGLQTGPRNVTYFVKDAHKFTSEYPRDSRKLRSLEVDIETQYRDVLGKLCTDQRANKFYIYTARRKEHARAQKKLPEAERTEWVPPSIPTPACDEFQHKFTTPS